MKESKFSKYRCCLEKRIKDKKNKKQKKWNWGCNQVYIFSGTRQTWCTEICVCRIFKSCKWFCLFIKHEMVFTQTLGWCVKYKLNLKLISVSPMKIQVSELTCQDRYGSLIFSLPLIIEHTMRRQSPDLSLHTSLRRSGTEN